VCQARKDCFCLNEEIKLTTRCEGVVTWVRSVPHAGAGGACQGGWEPFELSYEMSLLWLLVRGGFEKDELSPYRGYHRRIRPKGMISFLNQMTSMLAVQYCGERQR
jgi:hypothetical protein